MQAQNIPDQENVELQKTREYIRENVTPAKKGRKCVDGRYLPDQATGMIARPGGDCGYVMALLAVSKKKKLGLGAEQCFDAVYGAIVASGERFGMHTDNHSDPDKHTRNGLIGCGHLAKAAAEFLCEEYGVDAGQIKRLIEHARAMVDIVPHLDMVNLIGKHREEGVLVVKSPLYTAHSSDPDLGQMYFIYDEQRDVTFMKDLVGRMKIKGVTFEDMKKEADLQLQVTLGHLAKGLPIYAVSFAGKKPLVSLAGIV